MVRGSGTTLTKESNFHDAKKEKGGMVATASHQPGISKPIGGKYGAWGPVFKNKEHFINMHLS